MKEDIEQFGYKPSSEIEILQFRDKNLQTEIAQVKAKLKALQKARSDNSKKINKLIKKKDINTSVKVEY